MNNARELGEKWRTDCWQIEGRGIFSAKELVLDDGKLVDRTRDGKLVTGAGDGKLVEVDRRPGLLAQRDNVGALYFLEEVSDLLPERDLRDIFARVRYDTSTISKFSWLAVANIDSSWKKRRSVQVACDTGG